MPLNKELVDVMVGLDRNVSKKIIEDNHYSHKIPQAIKYRFGLYYDGILVGVAIFSVPANRYSITSIFEDETQHIGIELSRFYTDDDTPKNFESCALNKCLNYLKKNSKYDVVISYADPNFGHAGYLYQALNGYYIGQTEKEVRYLLDGKLITRRGLGRSKNDTEREHADRIISRGGQKVYMNGKYKYLFFIYSSDRKDDLIDKLKFDMSYQSDYPKCQEE